jgi:hypothetical protein
LAGAATEQGCFSTDFYFGQVTESCFFKASAQLAENHQHGGMQPNGGICWPKFFNHLGVVRDWRNRCMNKLRQK